MVRKVWRVRKVWKLSDGEEGNRYPRKSNDKSRHTGHVSSSCGR